MNKNKKVLLIIMTLLLTTTLFARKVSATYMYLDCAYNEEYKDKFNKFVTSFNFSHQLFLHLFA